MNFHTGISAICLACPKLRRLFSKKWTANSLFKATPNSFWVSPKRLTIFLGNVISHLYSSCVGTSITPLKFIIVISYLMKVYFTTYLTGVKEFCFFRKGRGNHGENDALPLFSRTSSIRATVISLRPFSLAHLSTAFFTMPFKKKGTRSSLFLHQGSMQFPLHC